MKFISFFNDIILIQLRRKDIFSSDTKKYPNRLEFSLHKNFLLHKNYFFLKKYIYINMYVFILLLNRKL